MKALAYDKLQDLKYFSQVFNETLRFEPPILFSSFMNVTEKIDIDGITVLPSDLMVVNMHQLHHDPDQWIKHYEYIPERFDSESPYFLTPSGKKRHPFAFSPFFGGRRICIGKTFAEIVSKVVVCGLLGRLHFEYADP